MQARLPDFIVIGAPKAGTSSLHFYLGLHPEIHMAHPKEPRFFVDAPPPAGHWSLGVDWYTTLFKTTKRFCGESSPQYAQAPSVAGVPGRLATVVPAARFIYLVREPMARLRSNYLMNLKRGMFVGSFADYVVQFPRAVDASCYGRQLEAYLRHYPVERFLVIESVELQADRRDTLRRIFRFIGADDSFSTPLFLHTRNVGKAERLASALGRRIENSRLLRFLKTRLHGGVYHHLRNLVLAPFSMPPPPLTLPAAQEREFAELFRDQVALLRTLTGLPLRSLDRT